MGQCIIYLQLFAGVIHFAAFVFLVSAGGLFCGAYIVYNNELNALGHRNNKICILDLKEDFTYDNNSTCIFVIAAEFVVALFLLFLFILSIVKIKRKLIRNNTCLTVEFSILVLSGIFAFIVAIILSSGWSVTCDAVHDKTKAAGISSECNYDYMKLIPASAGYAVLAVITIFLSVIITIIIPITLPCLKSQETDNENMMLVTKIVIP